MKKNYYKLPLVLLTTTLFSMQSSGQTPLVTYTDITKEAGIDFRYNFGDFTYENILESSGSGITILDYDSDGDMDLYLLNGTYLEGISDSAGIVFKDTPNQLYRNNGDGTFTNVAVQAGVDDRHWSMAAGALDYDGDLDIIVSHVDLRSTPVLLRNEGGNRNHWLGLSLVGNKGPASAIGAKVIVRSGDLEQVLINQWATSYLSYNDSRLHVGLGENSIVDILEIRWPDGEKEVFKQVEIDRYITVKQGSGIQ